MMYKALEEAYTNAKKRKVNREDEKGRIQTLYVDFILVGDMVEWNEEDGPVPAWLEVEGRKVYLTELGTRSLTPPVKKVDALTLHQKVAALEEKLPKTMSDAVGMFEDGSNAAFDAQTKATVIAELEALGVNYFRGSSLEKLQELLAQTKEKRNAKAA